MNEHSDVSIGAYDMDCELEVQCSCGAMLVTHDEKRTELTATEVFRLWILHATEASNDS